MRNLPTLAAVSLLALAALVTALFSGLIAYVDFYDAPFWDHWYHVDRDALLANPLARNNEHLIIVDHIFFWLDDQMFDSRGRFVQIVILAIMALQVATFGWLGKEAGVGWIVSALLAVVFVFSAFGFEVLIWQFELSLLLAFTCMVRGAALFAEHVRTGSRWALGLSFVVAWLGVLSLANGVLIPTLLAIMATLFGRRWSASGFGILALIAWAAQLSIGGGPSVLGGLAHPSALIGHFLVQLGAPSGFAAGYLQKLGVALPMETTALLVGIVVLALALTALGWTWMRKRRDPVFIALAAVILFALTSAALTSLGRSQMGLSQAMSSRYNVNAALLLSATAIICLAAASDLPGRVRNALRWAAPVGAAGLLIMATTGYYISLDLAGRYRGGVTGLTALVTGAPDQAAIGALAFDWEHAQRETAKMKIAGKWMFADAAAGRIGGRLGAEELAAAGCGASAWSYFMPHEKDGYRVLHGEFARTGIAAGAKHVLIVDATGTITGYGRVARRASDLNPLAQADGRTVDWAGHVRSGAVEPLTAWLGDTKRVKCGLGAGTSVPAPSSP